MPDIPETTEAGEDNNQSSPDEQLQMTGAEISRKAEELHSQVCELLEGQPLHGILIVFSQIYAGAVAQFAQLQVQSDLAEAPAGVAFSPAELQRKELLAATNELARFAELVRRNREALRSKIITKVN